ncbi:MAG: polyphenol oxidase family protein [candidate division WOR-3 bacterium]
MREKGVIRGVPGVMRSSWQYHKAGGVSYYELNHQSVRCIVTTRQQGESQGPYAHLNLTYGVGDDPKAVFANRRMVEHLVQTPLVTLRQVHSTTVHYLTSQASVLAEVTAGDALITQQSGIALAVKIADCLPVFIFGPDLLPTTQDSDCCTRPAPTLVAVAHAGWRGALKGTVAKTALFIQDQLGIPTKCLKAAFGPCIARNCYPVGQEIARQFLKGSLLPSQEGQEPRATSCLDLKAIVLAQLTELGIDLIADLDICPHCRSDLFYSVRRASPTGRNLAIILRT